MRWATESFVMFQNPHRTTYSRPSGKEYSSFEGVEDPDLYLCHGLVREIPVRDLYAFAEHGTGREHTSLRLTTILWKDQRLLPTETDDLST
jgi:hypothetical protein